MGYNYVSITNAGFGIVRYSGCTSEPGFNSLSDPAHTSYYIDYNNPCGFSSGYTYNIYGKSSKSNPHIPEGKVFTIDGKCLSVVWIEEQYLPGSLSLTSLDGLTPQSGNNPCFDCQPPFTGFTYYNYSGTTCTGDKIIVYDISPYVFNSDPLAIRSPQIGQKFLYHEYDVNGNLINPGNSCVTIDGYIGEFTGSKVVVPLPGGNPGATYSVPVGPILTGGGEITNCDQCIPHWNITTVRCDGGVDLIGFPIFSTTKPAIGSAIKTNANDGVCRRVTEVFPLKFIPYLGGFIGNMHTQIYYVDSSYTGCSSCTGLPDGGGGTPQPSQWSLTSGNSNGATVCGNYTSPSNRTTIYADPSVVALADGVHLYYSWSPLVNVSDGWVSNGTNYWTITNGILSNQTSCPVITSHYVTNLIANVGTFDDQGGIYQAESVCSIQINGAVSSDTTFNVSVSSDILGVQTFDVTIIAGNTSGDGYGSRIGANQSASSVSGCINSITSPDGVTYTGYGC
jgi:hypothetical protein